MAVTRRPRISLDLLRGFESAARHLSFTLAGKELCVTQSAVSRQIKALEAQSGQTLFLRINRGLQLTEAGQTLYAAVSQAHGLVDDAIDQLTDPLGGATLVIGAAVPFASLLLVPALPDFLASNVVRNLRISSSNEPAELERMPAHVVIRHYAQGAAPAGAVWLANDAVLPVCAPALLRRPSPPLAKPDDLRNHTVLRYETIVGGRAKTDWVRWLRVHGATRVKPQAVLSFSQYDQVVQAAMAGIGIALGRLPLAAQHLADGRLVAPFADAVVETGAWHALLAAGLPRGHPAHACVEWLRSIVRPIQRP